MRMLRTLFLTGSVLMLLCACGAQQEPAAPTAETQPALPKQENRQPADPPTEAVVDGGLDEEMTVIKDADGLPLLTARVTRPDVSGLVGSAVKKVIDHYYDDLYQQEQEWWTGGLVDFARENKKAAADYGGDFLPFSVTETNEIVYDGAAFLSIRRDLETYTGGAHGSHVVSCENFRKSDGSLVKLADLFRSGEYKAVILERIADYISETQSAGALYDNWKDMLDSSFDEAHFLIDRESLTIVYQEYDIAPYSSGTQFFPVSYADISNELNEPFLRDIYGGKE